MTSVTPLRLRTVLDDSPMTWFQWRAILVCVVLNMVDGFDVLVMSFTAKPVGAEWGLSGSVLGLLLSAGLIGLALGVGRIGAILAPIAAGALLDDGWTPQALYLAVAVLVLLAAVVLLGLRLPVTPAPGAGDRASTPARVETDHT